MNEREREKERERERGFCVAKEEKVSEVGLRTTKRWRCCGGHSRGAKKKFYPTFFAAFSEC